MSYYERARKVYEQNEGRTVKTAKYEAVVCGFHFKWDDSDGESIILAVTDITDPIWRGIHYMLHGDVYRTHQQNRLGYDFLWFGDLEKYGLILK